MNDEHGAAGRQLQRQIVGTSTFVFLTFLLQAMFSIMNAVSFVPQNEAACNATAGGDCDPTCFNLWCLMLSWMRNISV